MNDETLTRIPNLVSSDGHTILSTGTKICFVQTCMSQHVITATWERLHFLLFCFYEVFVTYMHMLILSVLYLPVTKFQPSEIFYNC
jgi:hypothetical protein